MYGIGNNLFQQYPQQYPQQQMNNNFVPVRSIEEAYNWPIAPGNSITFKIENAPYVCTKTKGFSPLEPPIFEKYRLVKEEAQNHEPVPVAFDAKSEIKSLWDEIKSLKERIGGLKDDEPADVTTVQAVHE